MSNVESPEPKEAHEKHGHPHDKRQVTVKIDGNEVTIDAGHYLVTDLKTRLGVPSEYELEIVEDGQFRPLGDQDRIKVEDHDEFVSHVRCGASS